MLFRHYTNRTNKQTKASIEMSNSTVIVVNNKMNELFGNLALEVAINAVRKCAEKYGFDAEEALMECGLDSIDNHVVFNKTKKVAAKKDTAAAAAPQLKLAKPKYPFPFSGEYNKDCCQGLKYNRGLFTQCLFIKTKIDGETGEYCKRCSSQAEKNDHGKPDCGSIQDRLNSDIMEFRDPKGRAPISFLKVIRKLKYSQDAIMEEAGKFNIKIHDIHFVEPPPPGKKGRKAAAVADEDDAAPDDAGEKPTKKGRPSSKKQVVVSSFAEEETNLFETLTQKAAAAAATASQDQDQEDQDQENQTASIFHGYDDSNTADDNGLALSCPPSPSPASISSSSQDSQDTSYYTANGNTVQSAPVPAPAPVVQLKEPGKEPGKEKKSIKKAAAKDENGKKLTKEEKDALKLAEKEAAKAAKLAEKEAAKAIKLAEKKAAAKAAKVAEKKAAAKPTATEEPPPKKKAATATATATAAKAPAPAPAPKKDDEDASDDEEEDDEEDEDLAKQEAEEDEQDEDASIQLRDFKFAGKKYMKDQFETVYSREDGQVPTPIGKWDAKKRTIVFNSNKEDDEGSEEEADEYEE